MSLYCNWTRTLSNCVQKDKVQCSVISKFQKCLKIGKNRQIWMLSFILRIDFIDLIFCSLFLYKLTFIKKLFFTFLFLTRTDSYLSQFLTFQIQTVFRCLLDRKCGNSHVSFWQYSTTFFKKWRHFQIMCHRTYKITIIQHGSQTSANMLTAN